MFVRAHGMMKRARIESLHASPPSGESADHYRPKISRKIRACQACQNRKIKCALEPGQEQCARCSRLGLKCIVNKSLQTLLDGENEWKKNIETQLEALQSAMAEVQSALLDMSRPRPRRRSSGCSDEEGGAAAAAVPPRHHLTHVQPILLPTGMTRENSVEAEARQGEHQAMVNAPMASLYEVTKLRNVRSDPWARGHHRAESAGGGAAAAASCAQAEDKPDFIAQGKLGVPEAERLFASFRRTLNAYLWGGITLVHDTLDETRASSPLLTAAILAVTALHVKDDGRAFDICYPIFLELVSQAVFDRYHTLDDVRGLCIGAFYLSDLSWKLSGLAVRIATELNLHQSCAMAQRDRPEYVEEARLWYLLYVCDHHFSIAYGRPPVICENPTISRHEDFLQLPGTTMSDHRLHSQVGVFIILSRIYHTFGPDRSRMIASDDFDILRRFDADLAHWRNRWKPRLAPNPHIADYPAKGVILHYHFARLQLFSICLRGLRPTEQYSMSNERRELVNLAISSAFGALELILHDADMRPAVNGVPLYLLTTIAYACLFLMKAQTQWRCANLDIRYGDVASMIEGVVDLLDEVSPCTRHVAHYLGRGLRGMLAKFKEHNAMESQQQQQQPQPQHLQAGQAVAAAPSCADGVSGSMWTDWDSWMLGSGNLSAGPHFALDQEQQCGLSFLDALSAQMPG